MPITKERMQDLLFAAREIEQHFTATCTAIVHTINEHTLGQATADETLAQIMELATNADRRITRQHYTIELELMHHRLTNRKNERDRIRRYAARHPDEAFLRAEALQHHAAIHTPRDRRTPAPTRAVPGSIPQSDEPDVQYDEDTLREMHGGYDEPYVSLAAPLASGQLFNPDFEGEFKPEHQLAREQVDSTKGHEHEATLHDDHTISCSCGAVQHASRTIWNEHYHLTHDGEKVIR